MKLYKKGIWQPFMKYKKEIWKLLMKYNKGNLEAAYEII